jgi:hypothetical protein
MSEPEQIGRPFYVGPFPFTTEEPSMSEEQPSYFEDHQHIHAAFDNGEYDWFSVAKREDAILCLQTQLKKVIDLMFIGRDLNNEPHLRELQLAQSEAFKEIQRTNNYLTTKSSGGDFNE